MILALLSLCGLSFILSWLLTFAVRRVAIRINFVDKPGHRKIHSKPIALGGGIAIFLAFALPMTLVVAGALLIPQVIAADGSPRFHELKNALVGGVQQQAPLALSFLGACLVLHLMGLRDDRKALGPYSKLLVQLAVAAAIVALNPTIRAVTAWGYWP